MTDYKFVTQEDFDKLLGEEDTILDDVQELFLRLLAERDAVFKAGEEAFVRGYIWAKKQNDVLSSAVKSEEFNENALREEFHAEAARLMEGK